jgi:hypothetical protein
MRLVRFLEASLRELVALVVDDVVTFAGGALALVGTYLLAHNRIADAQHWGGFALLGVVWVGLGISFARDSKVSRRRAAATDPVVIAEQRSPALQEHGA